MRTPVLGSAFYAPSPAPVDPEEFRRYVENEFSKVSAVIQLLADGHIDKTYAAPARPRTGDIRFADGTMWNPGAGEGVYVYRSAAWYLLG